MKKILYLVLLLPFIFSSCNNDLEVIGEWKEVAIVYGLLDPGQEVNYVRVQKAFLGEGNALIMAQHHDSIYYGENLSVVMERRKNGQILSTIIMERDTTVIKEPGNFTTEGHVLYKTSQKIFSDSEYNLVIHNEQSNYLATAFTPVIDSLTIMNPTPNPLQTVGWIDNNGPAPYIVRWSTGKDAKVYEVTMRFYYGERKLSDVTADTTVIELRFPRQKSTGIAGGQVLTFPISGEEFFNFLKARIPAPAPDYYRVAGDVEFIITSGGEEFSTYLDVTGISPGVSQSTPTYTNINNGQGLFSTRTTQSIRKDINSVTKDYIACNETLKYLGFLMNNQQVCP